MRVITFRKIIVITIVAQVLPNSCRKPAPGVGAGHRGSRTLPLPALKLLTLESRHWEYLRVLEYLWVISSTFRLFLSPCAIICLFYPYPHAGNSQPHNKQATGVAFSFLFIYISKKKKQTTCWFSVEAVSALGGSCTIPYSICRMS